MDKVLVHSQGRVTSVNTKRNEITLDNEDADLKLKDLTVKVAKGFDFYEVEGLTIKAWYANGEVVLYTVTDEVKFDATKYDADDKEIILVTEDESYEVARGAVLVLDGKKVDAKDFKADYAKVVLNEDNEIAWAEGFAIDGFIVVEEIKGTEVVSFNDDDLNLKGYTLVKDGKTIAIEDLEELDVVFYNDGEDFAVVYNNSTVGEIERVYTNEFKFDGKVYASTNALYLDEDVMGKLDADILAGMMDEEEDVNVFFNFKGEVVLVVGARGVAKTSSFYGIVYNTTNFFAGRSGAMMSFDVRNDAGELVKYDLSKTFMDKAANYDGPTIVWTGTTTDLKDEVVKVTVDEDGDITKVVVLEQKDLDKEFKTTATYARAGNVDYRLQSSTVVFYNSNKKAIKLGDVDKEFSKVTTPGKIVEDKGRVVVVVATSTDADSDSTKHTGLVTKVRKLSSDAYEFTIKVAGKTEIYVTESKTLNITESDYKDKIVTLEIGDKSGNIVGYGLATGAITNAVVESRNTTNNTIVTDKGTFELTSNAVIYNSKFAAINLRDLAPTNVITVYRDGNSNRFVNYVLVGAVDDNTPGETGVVTYIDGTTAKSSIELKDSGTKTLAVKYNNADSKDIIVEKDKLVIRLVGTDGTVQTHIVNTAGELALPGKVNLALGSVVITGQDAAVTSGTVAINAFKAQVGKNYTLRVSINGLTQEDELAVKVLNNDARLESLSILGKVVTLANADKTTAEAGLTVSLPFAGTDLTKLVETNVSAKTQLGNKAVVTVTPATSNAVGVDATVVVVVTAEDGTATKTYTVAVKKAAASKQVGVEYYTIAGNNYASSNQNVTTGGAKTETVALIGATDFPTAITVKLVDETAKVTLLTETATPGIWTFTVTGEDTAITATYTVTLTK